MLYGHFHMGPKADFLFGLFFWGFLQCDLHLNIRIHMTFISLLITQLTLLSQRGGSSKLSELSQESHVNVAPDIIQALDEVSVMPLTSQSVFAPQFKIFQNNLLVLDNV